MDPVKYVHTDGRTRLVTSVDSVVNANADGFYHPESPSGKRILAMQEASQEQPSEKWSHAQLDEYAAKVGVEVDGTKAEKVRQLAEAANAPTEVDNGAGVETPDLDTADRRVTDEAPATDDTV